jgi:hypothetical protein
VGLLEGSFAKRAPASTLPMTPQRRIVADVLTRSSFLMIRFQVMLMLRRLLCSGHRAWRVLMARLLLPLMLLAITLIASQGNASSIFNRSIEPGQLDIAVSTMEPSGGASPLFYQRYVCESLGVRWTRCDGC